MRTKDAQEPIRGGVDVAGISYDLHCGAGPNDDMDDLCLNIHQYSIDVV